ncbi:MAG TPA: hypothetical protein VFR35_01100 [Actinoplanes sp.]|nr:hypothetical protein [Actinoplanes sp.]
MKNAHMFPEVVTASRVSSMPRTVHGCRPTSVTTQPASRHTMASTPETAVARKNQRERGRSRRRHHTIAASWHAPNATATSTGPAGCGSERTGGHDQAGGAHQQRRRGYERVTAASSVGT